MRDKISIWSRLVKRRVRGTHIHLFTLVIYQKVHRRRLRKRVARAENGSSKIRHSPPLSLSLSTPHPSHQVNSHGCSSSRRRSSNAFATSFSRDAIAASSQTRRLHFASGWKAKRNFTFHHFALLHVKYVQWASTYYKCAICTMLR